MRVLTLPRAAAAAAVALALACGGSDPAAPEERSTLHFSLSSDWTTGRIDRVAGDAARLRLTCGYSWIMTVDGTRPVRPTGASVVISPLVGGDLPPAIEQRFDSAEVVSWFGGPEVVYPYDELSVESWVTYRVIREPYGALGAHQARWTLYYHGGARDSVSQVVECRAPTAAPVIGVRDSRTGRPATGVVVRLGEHSRPVTRFGTGWFAEGVVVGRYPLTFVSNRHQPMSDTTLDLGVSTHVDFRLVRTVPDVDRFDFGCSDGVNCAPTVEWYDRRGVAELPPTVRLVASNALGDSRVDTLVSGPGEILDAHRRRYTFPRVPAPGFRLEFRLTNASGESAHFVCTRSYIADPNWDCLEPA